MMGLFVAFLKLFMYVLSPEGLSRPSCPWGSFQGPSGFCCGGGGASGECARPGCSEEPRASVVSAPCPAFSAGDVFITHASINTFR